MTCIVATKDSDGAIYIGGDRCASSSYTWQEAPDPKVFTRELDSGEPIGFGIMGSWCLADILRHSIDLPRYPSGMNEREWVVTCLVHDYFKSAAQSHGYVKTKEGEISQYGGFIVGFKSEIYIVLEDFAVLRSPSWGCAIGSGLEAARGSLFTTQNEADQNYRVLRALESSEAVTPSVRGPFDVVTVPA